MHRLKRNVRKGAQFFSLAAFFLLCFMGVEIWGQESGSPLKTGTRSESVLTLTDVINLALRANRSLISSTYGVKNRKYSLDAAQSEFELKLIPGADARATDDTSSVGAGVTVEKKFAPGPVAALSPRITRFDDDDDSEAYSGEFGISLILPLLRGFGSEINLNSVRTAEYSLRTAHRSHYLVKVNIVIEAVSATYDIVEQGELVRLYQDQTKSFQGHVVMAKAREKIGLATPIDVYRAEIQLKDAQDNLTRAREALRSAGDRLKIVLAAPLEQAIQVVAPVDYQPLDVTLEEAVAAALQNRVELKQIDDQIEEARRASRVAKNNLLPQLDLVANYTRSGSDDTFSRSVRLNEDFWSINLTSTTDWSRTAEKAAYQQALLAVKTDELNRWTRIDGIKREVRQNFDSLLKAAERMQIRKEQINQASGKLALAEIKFGYGMANNFDVIEAQTELQTARVNLLAAKIEHIVGRYRLRAAMGTLIES
ncbi:MAG: TolC family protein [Desulfobacterales bacterium]